MHIKVLRHFVKKKKSLNRHIVAPANPKVGKPYVNRFRMSCFLTPCKGYYSYRTPVYQVGNLLIHPLL